MWHINMIFIQSNLSMFNINFFFFFFVYAFQRNRTLTLALLASPVAHLSQSSR